MLETFNRLILEREHLTFQRIDFSVLRRFAHTEISV